MFLPALSMLLTNYSRHSADCLQELISEVESAHSRTVARGIAMDQVVLITMLIANAAIPTS